MTLIGLFVLALMWAQPAHADPISVALLGAISAELAASATAVAITSVLLSVVASTALSFVSQALFKPPARSGGGSSGGSAPTVDNKVTIRQAAAARPIIYGETRVSGIYGFVHATENNENLRLILMFAGHEIEAFSEVWFNDEAVSIDGEGYVVSGNFAGKAFVLKHFGAADQAADANLIGYAGGLWTSTDRLAGIAYLYVTLNFDARVYSSGVPNITAVIKGRKDIYDPRTATTGYSSNPALCLANYLCDTVYGVGVDYATGIDETALIAAANACDEDVDLAGGGTEKRYSCDGVVSSSLEPQAIIGRLLGAMHGRLVYDGERWKIIAGVYQTPTLTFTDDDLRAGPRIRTLTSRRDLFNGVKGTYFGPGNKWQEADFPAVKSALYKAADGGREIWKDMQLPMTRSPARAQRIAKIDLLKIRQPIAASMPGKLSLWRCQAGDTVAWTSDRYGWTAKPFEVAKATFAVDSANGAPTLGVDLELRETAAAVYDFATSEESTVDPAPNTNFPSVFGAMPPSNLTVTEALYATRTGGGVKAKVTLAWDASPDAFVTSGGGYLAQYRVTGTSAWVPLPQTAALAIDILDIDPATYDFRVFAVNWAGNLSDTALQALARPIAGLSAAPSAPGNLSLVPIGNFAVLRWDYPPDLDVEIGGTIVFRHSSKLTGATWADGVTVSQPLPAAQTFAVLPLVAGTYMAKYADASGVWSVTFASFATAQSGALAFAGLTGGSRVEDPGFSGTKTHCVALGGTLRLGGAGLFSAIPLVSAVPSIAYYGGVRPTGTYGWSAKVDLGSKKRCRGTLGITSLSTNVVARISQRSGNVSTWARFGGAITGNETDAYTEIRFTDDDPNGGSPSWSAWTRFDVGEFYARGFDLRTTIVSNDAAYDRLISALSATFEEIV